MPVENLKQIRLNDAWDSFKSGDFDSLGILFELHYQELFYYGIKVVDLSELVKDTIQDLFADVWERRDKMMNVANFKAYLIISLRRELIRRAGKLRTESLSSEISSLQFSFSAEEFLINDEEIKSQSRILANSLSSLTEKQREVILLRFFHNLEFEEMAQILDINIQSIRNLLFRSLEKVRKDMDDQGITNTENIEMMLWVLFSQKKN